MAINSQQERMSAMHHASPWRGPMVDAAVSGFTAGNRAAALFLYAIASAAAASGEVSVGAWWSEGGSVGKTFAAETSVGSYQSESGGVGR